MHLKMMGASSNLSPDEMMALHVNGEAGEAGGDRRWNEGDNRPRWPIFPPVESPSATAAMRNDAFLQSSLPQAPAVQLWAPAVPALKPQAPVLPSSPGIARTLAAVTASLAAAGQRPGMSLSGGSPFGSPQAAPAATATCWPPGPKAPQVSRVAAETLSRASSQSVDSSSLFPAPSVGAEGGRGVMAGLMLGAPSLLRTGFQSASGEGTSFVAYRPPTGTTPVLGAGAVRGAVGTAGVAPPPS